MGPEWDTSAMALRALGLQPPGPAAARSKRAVCSEQTQRMRNYSHLSGLLQNAKHSTACPLRSRYTSSATPEVRGATTRENRTPSAHPLDETLEMVHAPNGHGSPPGTHRQVQVQRSTLREMARCPQRRLLVLHGMYSTTGTGAAYHAGVGGAMYSSTSAGATQDGRCWCCVPQPAQLRRTQSTAADAAYLAGAGHSSVKMLPSESSWVSGKNTLLRSASVSAPTVSRPWQAKSCGCERH